MTNSTSLTTNRDADAGLTPVFGRGRKPAWVSIPAGIVTQSRRGSHSRCCDRRRIGPCGRRFQRVGRRRGRALYRLPIMEGRPIGVDFREKLNEIAWVATLFGSLGLSLDIITFFRRRFFNGYEENRKRSSKVGAQEAADAQQDSPPQRLMRKPASPSPRKAGGIRQRPDAEIASSIPEQACGFHASRRETS